MSFNCPSFKEQTTGEESRLGPFSICSALHCIWSCILSHLDKQMKNTYFSIHSIYSWPYHLTVTCELANFCWRHYDMEELSYEYQWVVHHWSRTIFWYKLIPFFTTLMNAWKHGKKWCYLPAINYAFLLLHIAWKLSSIEMLQKGSDFVMPIHSRHDFLYYSNSFYILNGNNWLYSSKFLLLLIFAIFTINLSFLFIHCWMYEPMYSDLRPVDGPHLGW